VHLKKKKIGYLPPSPLDIVYGQPKEKETNSSDVLKVKMFINRIREIQIYNWDKLKKYREKYKAMHDHHRVEKTLKIEYGVWFHLGKENKRL